MFARIFHHITHARLTPRLLAGTFVFIGIAALVGLVLATPARTSGQTPRANAGGNLVYLPLVAKAGCASSLRLNAPRFSGVIPFEQTAIAWFGRVSPTQNYSDIRVGYNATELYVYLAIFDRRLWYDETPSVETLTQWDAVTLLLDTANGSTLSPASWRFVAQLYGEPSASRRAAYRGSAFGDSYHPCYNLCQRQRRWNFPSGVCLFYHRCLSRTFPIRVKLFVSSFSIAIAPSLPSRGLTNWRASKDKPSAWQS